MTASAGLTQIRDVVAWARGSNVPDAEKIRAMLPALDAAIAQIERSQTKAIPEGFVLAAVPFAVKQTPTGYIVIDPSLLDWVLSQVHAIEHIEVIR